MARKKANFTREYSLWIDFELSSKKFNGELSSSSSSVFVKWIELELTTEFAEKTELNWELQFSFELRYSSGFICYFSRTSMHAALYLIWSEDAS